MAPRSPFCGLSLDRLGLGQRLLSEAHLDKRVLLGLQLADELDLWRFDLSNRLLAEGERPTAGAGSHAAPLSRSFP